MLWSAVGASAAVVLAWALAWASRTPGAWRWVAVACTAVGLATPGPVAGMALVFGFRGWRAVYDSAAMFVLADVLRTLPYALLVLWPAVRLIPPALLESAALDGLDGWGQAWRVAIPSTRGALVAAWGVAFVLSLGELPATNLVAPPGVTPITVVLWGLLHTGVESHTAGVALVMLAAVAVAGLFATWALARPGVIPGGGRRARL
jgi:iron(III) transport system permease protein